jgi:hypothetical protein
MSVFFNGIEQEGVHFNGTELEKVYANGTLVYEDNSHVLVPAAVNSLIGNGNGFVETFSGSMTPETFVSKDGTRDIKQFYTDDSATKLYLKVLLSGESSNSQDTLGDIEITGTFSNGATSYTFSWDDAEYYFEGVWHIPYYGRSFIAGNTYTIKWTQ